MKSIQSQYRDLVEGRMSKANFMRNVRMQFPQHISPVTSFDDSVKILKGKRILSEIKIKEYTHDTGLSMSIDQQLMSPRNIALAIVDELSSNSKDEEIINAIQNYIKDQGIARDVADRYMKKDGWLEAVKQNIFDHKSKNLQENKKPQGVYGHNPNAEMDEYRRIDHLNYYQVYNGIQYELAKMSEITDENYIKARKKVVGTILKDPDAYKNLQLANFKAVKEMDEDLKMKEVKKNNHTDKPNEMKAVKKDAKGNTQDNLGKKEAKKSKNGKGVEHMTQTPKGKLEAFPTPGKEKVMALKEHILDELMTSNPHHEEFHKGMEVYKKKGSSGPGEIIEYDGHTATVKWEDGTTEDLQKNVLTKEQPVEEIEAQTEEGQEPLSEKESILQKIKERLVKALKTEKIKKNPQTGTAVSTKTAADDALAAKMGYTQTIPSTIEPLGKM